MNAFPLSVGEGKGTEGDRIGGKWEFNLFLFFKGGGGRINISEQAGLPRGKESPRFPQVTHSRD